MPSKTKRAASDEPEDEELEHEKHGKEQEDEGDEIELPDLDNPYATLEVAEDASADQIKKAYRKLSLKHHPDKASSENKDAATAAFQKLTAAYALLSDERRRARYDRTGDASETLLDDDDFNWADFFREQFRDTITEAKIASFTQKYRGSAEERDDVLRAYKSPAVRGKMASLYESVMLSNMLEDEDRFRAIIDEAIKEGKAEPYSAYMDETEAQRTKRMDRARKQAEDEAKEAAEELGKMQKREQKQKGSKKAASKAQDIDSLAALIQGKDRARRSDNFLANLEAKYAAADSPSGKGKKRRRGDPPEPSEAEFAAAQAKLGRKR